MSTEKTYYTPNEAAEILGISKRVVQKWCKESKLKCIKVGGRYRIEKGAVDVFRTFDKEEEK